MRIFGYDILSKARDNKYIPDFLLKYFYGREWAKRQDERSLLQAYRSWVYVCASRNAATFATTNLQLFVAKPTTDMKMLAPTKAVSRKKQEWLLKTFDSLPQVKKAVEIVEVLEHPFLDVVTSVNPYMNKTDLFEISDIYQELTGDCYWYLPKTNLNIPEEIWPLSPDKMFVIPDPKEFISHYIYRVGEKKIRFEKDEIVHFKWPNPNDPYYGASPLQAIADTYNINQNMNNYENALFTNNAKPQGFFIAKEELSQDAFDRLKGELRETWAGVMNSGKIGLLEDDMKFEKVEWSPREMGFLKGREWTKQEIFEAYDTPLGLYDKNATEANAKSAERTYAKYCIRPRHRRFEEKLNEQVMPRYDEKLFVAFENVVPEDKEFKLKEDIELLKASAMSINEVRQSRGAESIENGEVPYIPQGMVPLGTPPAAPGGFGQFSLQQEPSQKEIDEAVEEISDRIVERLVG